MCKLRPHWLRRLYQPSTRFWEHEVTELFKWTENRTRIIRACSHYSITNSEKFNKQPPVRVAQIWSCALKKEWDIQTPKLIVRRIGVLVLAHNRAWLDWVFCIGKSAVIWSDRSLKLHAESTIIKRAHFRIRLFHCGNSALRFFYTDLDWFSSSPYSDELSNYHTSTFRSNVSFRNIDHWLLQLYSPSILRIRTFFCNFMWMQ